MVDAQLESLPSSPVESKDFLAKPPPKKSSQFERLTGSRVDIDEPLNRLHEVLGDQWSLYQTIVTDFLTGRITRLEFEDALAPLIASSRHFIRFHNDILICLLTNSFREPPSDGTLSLGWSRKRRATTTPAARGDPTAKRLKSEVMALTNRERARIKSITKPDASQRLRPNSMIETRFAKLPRVPMTPQKINSSQHHIDIVRGIHVPLATESHYLPDSASLKDRILAICLENGLLGGQDEEVPDLLIAALDIHLRNILTATLSKVRANRIDCLALPTPSLPPVTHTTMLPATGGANGTAIVNGMSQGNTGADSSAAATATVIPTGGSTATTATTATAIAAQHAAETTLVPDELAFTHALAPHIYVEPCHPVTRMMAIALDDTMQSDSTWAEFDLGDKSNQRARVAKMLDELI